MIYFKNFLIVIYYILLVYELSGSYKCREPVGVVAVNSAVFEWKGTSNNSINIFQHNCLLLLFTYVYLQRHWLFKHTIKFFSEFSTFSQM